jgi:AcrR family transcriptional regulator
MTSPDPIQSNSSEDDEHEDLREEILRSCFELVRSEGTSSLSMRRIAKEADTTTQMIYTLFGNKETLLEELYEAGSRRMLERARNTDPDQGPLEHLYQMGHQYREFALENRELYQAMFNRTLTDQTIVQKTELFDLTADALEKCLEQGILEYGDPETITETFWAGIHGSIGLELAGYYENEADAKAAYDETLRAIFDGYRVDDPSTEIQ